MFTLRPDKAARFFAQQASLFYDKGNNGQTPAVKELLAAAEARNHLEEILLAGAKYLNADAKSRQAEHRLDSNKSVPSDLNLSNMCGNQTLHLLNGVSNGSMWALQSELADLFVIYLISSETICSIKFPWLGGHVTIQGSYNFEIVS